MQFSTDVVVVGGCGHVGLPLALAFASRGLTAVSYDINAESVAKVNAGEMPFLEPGAPAILREALNNGTFRATTDRAVIADSESVVIVVGTPVDEHLNPDPQAVPDAVGQIADQLRAGQLLVLRSTIYPGVTSVINRRVAQTHPGVDVCFCPERIAEGKAFTELFELPQIVSGATPDALARAKKLFSCLTAQTVEVTCEEAELVKLFTNTWRYIKFAAANQLFMIANDYGLDFENIRRAITFDYPRAADLPSAGFAAGPCLFKDTMQLAAYNNNNFTLGHSSMMVNEGLPLYIVSRMERRFVLQDLTVGILGMAFKAESDDVRSSLSYKLKRILRFKSKQVLCTDPYVRTDPDLVGLDEMLEQADLLVVGTPHQAYRELVTDLPVIDVWNVRGEGVTV